MLAVVRAAFGARPPLDPPADALAETVELDRGGGWPAHGGLLAAVDGEPVGALVLDPDGDTMYLRRFGVVPVRPGHGVAAALIDAGARGRRRASDDLAGGGPRGAAGDGPLLGATGLHARSPRDAPNVELARPVPHGVRRARRRRDARPSAARLAGQLGAGRPGRAHRRARRRQDDVHPGARRRARRPRRGHLADVRHRPRAPRRWSAGRRWCTSTPTGSAASRSSTTSTWTPPSTRRSPSSSGARGWPRGWPESRLEVRIVRAAAGTPGPDEPDPRRVLVAPVGPRWLDAVAVRGLDLRVHDRAPHRHPLRRAARRAGRDRARSSSTCSRSTSAPDVLLVTGDVADHGTAEEYAEARAVLGALARPDAGRHRQPRRPRGVRPRRCSARRSHRAAGLASSTSAASGS